jgi:hypothetical protein
MRKRLVPPKQGEAIESADWLDLSMVTVEISSEDPAYRIESALVAHDGDGWRAAEPGVQRVCILFDQPQNLRRIFLEFVEPAAARTQEFLLRWAGVGEATKDIVRQQWNFSPAGAVSETEDYRVELPGAKKLELILNPDVNDGGAYASLRRLRLA